jgi:hypothetical protein
VILSPAEHQDFFSLMAALDLYTNRRLHVLTGVDDLAALNALGSTQLHKIRSAMWNDVGSIEEFIRTNPSGLSEKLLSDARLLHHAVQGQFFCERILKQHAIFISMGSPTCVYAVQGLSQRIDELLSRVQPLGVAVMLNAVLLPFRGRIVWDGLFTVLPVTSGAGIRRIYRAEYTRAKEAGAIVTRLGNEWGSKVRIPTAQTTDPRLPASLGAIVLAAESLGKSNNAFRNATLALLQASAKLAQVALEEDHFATAEAVKKAEQASRKVARTYDDLFASRFTVR